MYLKIIVISWFILLSVPLSMMMGSHQLSLVSSTDTKIKNLSTTTTDYTKLHFVNPDCGCSEKVVQSLIERKSRKDVVEKVFILGKNETWFKNLSAAGYDITVGDKDEFSSLYKITAVPQLIILNSEKKILYTGGYSSRRGPASVVEDEQILKEVQLKQKTNERLIYGCVNGSEFQSKVDLLGFKYKRKE